MFSPASRYWILWWRSGLCFGDLGVVVFVTTTIRSALFEYNVFEFAVFIFLVVRDFGDVVGFLLCVASIVVRLLNGKRKLLMLFLEFVFCCIALLDLLVKN
ncbi:hypothetical protein QVD17_18801 [Tagetes erecta]|uniref:Transmembrane protein n=1 Tax=Tagetes erecta TaxID=13708 RepID=A0AAD8NW05_TARER|nr:hypothetical protein QVD17_18801 [Tagetes erecta]